MTESEWRACDNPTLMLEFLRGKASDRKLRLFACSCCLDCWPGSPIEDLVRAYEVALRFADGNATEAEREEAFELAVQSGYEHYSRLRRTRPHGKAIKDENQRFDNLVGFAVGTRSGDLETHITSSTKRTRPIPVARLREVFNPFRPVALDPSWLTSTVLALAHGIYDDRAFDRCPILADALEESGCEDAQILEHCRGDGPHCKGCWCLDLILGKA